MKKIKTSWEIAKQCWRVLLLDRELVLFPLLSAAALLLVSASFFVPIWESGALQTAAEHHHRVTATQDPLLFVAYFAFYLVCYFVIIFFNSALVACAMIRLRGGDPTVADGLRAAMKCLPAIFGWALLSASVGMVLQAIEERVGFLGRLVVGLIGLSWAIASYFVIPTIVIENVGPVEALKRSASIIKKTWGETLTVQVGLSVVAFAAGLVAMVVIVGRRRADAHEPDPRRLGDGVGRDRILCRDRCYRHAARDLDRSAVSLCRRRQGAAELRQRPPQERIRSEVNGGF